ncbi:hypothetical protein AXF42_Ash003963 [Apostasia shenzhenica]|uniref:Uncharacterized protein n=1 Tax=Apostasia shenzhenica TaxID=1088818 RepID=A0A2I0AIG5_9ASPA|nr:hypothetical protein AXF42_Ash003963 [Apostasia shenzhenica]
MDSQDQLLSLCDQSRSQLHFPLVTRRTRASTATYTPQEQDLFTLGELVRHSPSDPVFHTSQYDPGNSNAYHHYDLHQTQFDVGPSAPPIDQDQAHEDSVDDDDGGGGTHVHALHRQ